MQGKYEKNRIFTLNEPNAPRLNPALAMEIGLNESLILLQIEFYLGVTASDVKHTHEGKKWIWKSTRDWLEVFPF